MAPPMERFLEDFTTELVTVTVGPEGGSKQYKVPKGVLRTASPWFEAALKDDAFKEGRTSTINMPEDRPEDFGILVYFLFHGSIDYEAGYDETNPDTRIHSLIQGCHIWTFAQKYLISGLKGCITSRICLMLDDENFAIDDSTPAKLCAATLTSAWQLLPDASPIRGIIADYIVATLDEEEPLDIEECINKCPGLVQAMHTSEAHLHKSAKGDFPRYRKPLKTSLLEKTDFPQQIWSYWPHWGTLSSTCVECGYVVVGTDIEFRCAECKKAECKDHDMETPLFLCGDCAADYD